MYAYTYMYQCTEEQGVRDAADIQQRVTSKSPRRRNVDMTKLKP